MNILRKSCLQGIKISERCNKKSVISEFYGKQNFKGIFLFNLIRRSLEFFRILRKNRDDIFVFGCAKALALALIFCLGAISESRAATNCAWDENNPTKLIISGSGTFSGCQNNPEFSNWKNKITEVVIEDGVQGIGGGVFNNIQNLTGSLTIPDSVTDIGAQAFKYTGLTSVILPHTLINIGMDAFRSCCVGKEIIISDETVIDNWSYDTFNDAQEPKETFVCLGSVSICQEKIKKFLAKSIGGTCPGQSGCMLGVNLVSANEKQCGALSTYYWSGKSCNNKKNGIVCAKGFKRIEDFCNRVRYTPAEAAEIAKDDGNVVTITFRK